METVTNIKNIKKNTILSTLSLFFQSGYAAVLGLIANLILTVVLTPKIFGIYIVTLSIISFLNYFSDIGLAASLVQKKEISNDDVKTTFTVQQILIVSMILLGFALTPFIVKFYNLPVDARYLYWALLFSFFLSSLKTIPSIFLERHIEFQKIVFVQIIENTVFYISVSLFAAYGFGLQSFTISVLIRALVGLIAMYRISFWKPQIGISMKSLKQLLSFGLPFQANSFLALIKDEFITLYLGKMLGFEALGYIGWAKRWAEAPIRIIMDNISRVLFPIFARFQHDKEKIAHLVEKIIRYQTLILAPTLFGMGLIMNDIVFIIPKYSKWAPALPLFYLFLLSAFLSSYSTPFINLFNALGKVKFSFYFMIYWTVTTWILTPILIAHYGMIGFPITQVILSLAFVVIIMKAKTLIPFEFLKAALPGVISALGMGTIISVFSFYGSSNLLTTISLVLIGVSTYLLLLQFIFRISLYHEIRSLLKYE